MSGRKFAVALGMSPTTVNQYLNGRMPPADFIALVCGRFGVNATWLLTGEGEMKPMNEYSVAEGQTNFRMEGSAKGQRVFISSKHGDKQAAIIIDEMHRSMIDLMDSAPQEKSELVALVKGYLMGKKGK